MEIFEFPHDWYVFTTQKFTLRSFNQVATMPWSGAGQAVSGPHTQQWISDVTVMPLYDPLLQDMDAFFTRLKGRSNVLRFSNGARLSPWHDRNLSSVTESLFSDDTGFSDGTGFVEGLLPPNIYLTEAASAGARFLKVGGLPASQSAILRRGDLLQIKPNGIAGTVPHLYKAIYSANSDASGETSVTIEPALRQGVAAGDVVSLRYCTSLFRLADDTQADIEISGGGQGNFGFSLVEALDLIP